ncbi:MAG: diacylglycerol kinase family lipid kinase [Prevotellaceae bacterium]|nr:diacylglycerol kinase family lipid kinase [Prevotellaceae bacterium]
MKKVAFIINPFSGVGKKSSLVRRLEGIFHPQNGWLAVFHYTTGPNDAFETSLRYREELYDLVVAVGGDGTVNQVACALLHSPVPMGIIPAGSGNGLARHLHIPLSVTKAIEVLTQMNISTIDSGEINGQPFFCTAGVGFDASLANRFNKLSTRGFASYLIASVKEFVQYRAKKYTLTIDNQTFDYHAFLITFANCSQWGNNIMIAPSADEKDGLLDMVVWKNKSKFSILLTATRLLFRRIDRSSHIKNFCGTSFTLIREQEGWVHFDGEHTWMGKTIHIGSCPTALKMVTPCLCQ